MEESSKIKRVVYSENGIQISLSGDALNAYVRFLDDYSTQIDLRAFILILQQLSIRHGLLPDAIKNVLAFPEPGVDTLIARGTPPVAGLDGSVRYVVAREQIRSAPKLTEDGKVDMKNLQTLFSFRTGEVLAELLPHTEGKPGKAVTGEPIPAQPGKPAILSVGKGTVISPDRTKLLAGIDGALIYLDGVIGIYPIFTVKDHVDYSVGNLDFVGTIVIRGNVLSGFKVKAEADISIDGLVEAAEVIAGNELVIRGGVQGGGRAVLQAGGSILASFIIDAKLSARARIEARGPILRCEAFAAEEIVAQGNDGEIVGGKLVAGRRIQAKNIGSTLGVATLLEVGTDPSLVNRIEVLRTVIAEDMASLKEMSDVVGRIKALGKRMGKLLPRNQKEIEAAAQDILTLQTHIEINKTELDRLESQLEAMKDCCVCVLETVHPGVSIKIGRRVFEVAETMKATRFEIQDEMIRAVPL